MEQEQYFPERSFLETTKKFFLPIKGIFWVYIGAFLTMSNWFVIDFSIVLFANKIGNLIEQKNIEAIGKYVVLFFVIFAITYTIKYLTKKGGPEALRYDLARQLRKDSLNIFFRMNISETEKIGTGKIIKIFSDGIQHFTETHSTILYLCTESLFKICIIGFVLIKLGTVYLIVYLVLFCFVIRITNLIFVNKVSYLRKLKREVGINNSRQFVRMIMSKIDILQNKQVFPEIEKYTQGIVRQKELAMENMKRVFLMFNIPLILVHTFFGCILIYVFVSLSQGYFSYGTFAALSIASSSLGAFMLKVTDGYKKVLDNFVEIEKLRDFFDQTPQMKNYNTGNTFQYQQGNINIKQITFAYVPGTPIFTDFSLSISGGKKIALVGMSGSGKSTLIKLIAGYMMPDSGTIQMDGQDIARLSLQSYFQHIGYLTQDSSIFDGTIKENLLYGLQKDLSAEKTTALIDTVIHHAKCEFISDLPHGLETEIGERGIKLSGGQRQRLAIAKIFLKDPNIILLDEPTSALDSFAEEAVTEAMNNLFAGRTVIIIAHRLQTVKQADEIIVLDNGLIRERGTHTELLASGGYYARMLELQSGF